MHVSRHPPRGPPRHYYRQKTTVQVGAVTPTALPHPILTVHYIRRVVVPAVRLQPLLLSPSQRHRNPPKSNRKERTETLISDMATESPESEVSGLDYEETELKLGLPGGRRAADSERKRGFSDAVGLSLGAGADPSVDSSESKVSGAGKQPAAKAQVVGWPPVRSFRKNVLKSCKYVKVAVDGAPYLRKVDLETYGSYQQLLASLEEMFSCFTICNHPDERRLVDPVNGMEYVPTYEDKEGDWMLVGDVPWKMFVESCKRLRLMKSSEAVNLAPRTPQRSTNAK